MSKQTLSFQAEVKQACTSPRIRSTRPRRSSCANWSPNASDACDKLRFEALATPEPVRDHPSPSSARGLRPGGQEDTDPDNGIGMNRESGPSAPSPRAARASSWRRSGRRPKKDANLIGQFGVGFYRASSSPTASPVKSRRAGLPPGRALVQRRHGDFEVETIDSPARAPTSSLHLREGRTSSSPAGAAFHHRQVHHIAAHPDAQRVDAEKPASRSPTSRKP